ncbi:mitochondrial ATPase (Afg1) protein [Rutstroemia sp. NJR-2017a BBW]|nr:mitochondrial ATPase (Afg1) protein [Rutstroemia sp. NJR-2017a BBW]
MASTFHTFILDDVPVLTLLQKNEARRLITLLDALYEARCKLVVRAQVGPDDLFFPETKIQAPTPTPTSDSAPNDGQDAVYPETLSEIYQDQTSPFRPNISTYTDTNPVKTGRFREHGLVYGGR